MNRTLLSITILTCGISLSSVASAATVGNLSWDGVSDFIEVNGSNTQYVQLAKYADLTRAQTDVALTSEGSLADFRIANQADAYTFYNHLFSTSQPVVDDVSMAEEYYNNQLPGSWSDGILGDNYSPDYDYAFFDSDDGNNAGLIQADPTVLTLEESWRSVADTDIYSENGIAGSISWLLVSDGPPIPEVPIPAAAFLFAPALLGFMGLRRKVKNSVA